MKERLLIGIATMFLVLGGQLLWADEPPGGPKEQGKGSDSHGGGMKGHHRGAGHFLRHLLMHQKEIGLNEDQVAKINAIQLELDKARIRTEAEIQVAERELDALVPDAKADLAAIEASLKRSGALQVSWRLAAIKAKREALALLTPEQREKEKTEHEKMMKKRGEHRMGERKGMEQGMGQGMKPGAERMDPAR
jgi:periplasmic protein CpxP/Spy